MKWIFLAFLIVMTPALTAFLHSKPQYRVHTCFVLGASLYIGTAIFTIAPISWRMWPDPVKGIEVSLVDALAVALLFSSKPVRIPSTVWLSFVFYCLALLVSTLAGAQVVPAIFYVWQVLRAVVVFLAIARVCASEPKAYVALLYGLGIGLIHEAPLVMNQFAHGVERPGGTFGHSNFLGLTADFVLFPMLALMMGTRRLLLPGATLFAGFVTAILGGSRAALAIFGLGIVLTVILSIRHKSTSRKMAFAGATAVLLLISAPVMIWANSRRSEVDKLSSNLERSEMKQAARMIIADYPFGVGPNQYVIIANVGGYSDRAGVPWDKDNRQAPVHDIYYLVTAEMGFLGLLSFLSVFGSVIILGFRLLRRHLPGENGELVPGLLATLIIVAAHNNFEFVFQESETHYLFAIVSGMLVAIYAKSNVSAKQAMQMRIPAPALSSTSLSTGRDAAML